MSGVTGRCLRIGPGTDRLLVLGGAIAGREHDGFAAGLCELDKLPGEDGVQGGGVAEVPRGAAVGRLEPLFQRLLADDLYGVLDVLWTAFEHPCRTGLLSGVEG